MENLENKTNSDLRYIIRWTEKKNEAWEQLLKQSPSNSDLRYIIEYTEKKNEAWEQLLKQSPSNEDLRYIIRWTEKKNEAGEQLLKQSPSNEDLRYIIEYTEKKNEAARELRMRFGYTVSIDEAAIIKEIATTVLNQPCDLKMDSWHCGTTHCLAGWAAVLNPIAREIEEKVGINNDGTETAGCAIIPSLAHLFFSSNEEVLEELKKHV